MKWTLLHWYCWWFRNPKQPPFGCIKPVENNGISYHINWWSPDLWTINHMFWKHQLVFMCLTRWCLPLHWRPHFANHQHHPQISRKHCEWPWMKIFEASSRPVEPNTRTVDGSEIRRSPVEVASLSHYLQGFLTSQTVVGNGISGTINRKNRFHKSCVIKGPLLGSIPGWWIGISIMANHYKPCIDG